MRGLASAALAAAVLAAVPATAGAAIPDSLKRSCERRDAADGDTGNGVRLPFWLCDDGTPDAGGLSPNPGAALAVPVPQRYGGDGYTGLPGKAAAEPRSGADAEGNLALDADVSLPDPRRFRPPRRGYPLVVMMHGCCGGNRRSSEQDTIEGERESWHYSNAWFASRGYVVLTYTARGFVDSSGNGSTGYTQLDSRRHELNDYQSLAGQLVDTTFTVAGRTVWVNPSRVVATGGSYGGGFTWLALTDPTWRSPGGRAMRLVAAAPKYGWTNLQEALVPNGHDPRDALPTTDPARADDSLGIPKRSIITGLYLTGSLATGDHTTFPPSLRDAFQCVQSPLPFEASAQCRNAIANTVPELIRDRSAYFQNRFFARIRRDRRARVPVFGAGAFSDPLFPAPEHRRMVERLRRAVRGYPVQEHYGDYNHFVQNKAKEWGDLCAAGGDHHVCRRSDYPGGNLNAVPRGRSRLGVTTRLNRFIDHYARPPGNPRQRRPARDVTASLQVCPANAGGPFPLDEPGERFTESSFGALAPSRLRLSADGTRTTTNKAAPNTHAASADPVANQISNSARCPVHRDGGGPGVAVYDFPPLSRDAVMIGRTRVTVPHRGTGSDLMLAARLYELLPDGSQVMVDRGLRRLDGPNGTTVLDLRGNGWRFRAADRLRLELAQDDDPHLRASNVPSSLTLAGATLDVPVRRVGPDASLRVPRLASDAGTSARVRVDVGARSGDPAGVSRTQRLVRDTRRRRARALRGRSFRGRQGRTYRVRARLFDRRGVPGDPVRRLTIVPLDDRARAIRYRGRWRRVRNRRAWGRSLRRGRRGATLRLRFRGDRLYLLGRASRRGGRALVQVNGRRRLVGFRGRRARNRRVVLRMRTRRRGVNRLRLRVVRGRVEIDGIGFRRR